MRTVKVQGGLGNQLFCLAMAHSVAGLTGAPVALDLAAYGADRYGHGFDLKALADQMGFALTRRPLLGSRGVTAALRRLPTGFYVSEPALAPQLDRLAAHRLAARGRYFNGYWQDEAYIAEPALLKRTVRDFLLAKAGPGPTTPLVIHYRTYKEELHPARRETPDTAFFHSALARLDALDLDPADIVLISDDPALARVRLGPLAERVSVRPGAGPWADMALMLRAERLVLSNSSFSWWGGYCGEARQAIYPARGSLFHYPRPAAAFTVL